MVKFTLLESFLPRCLCCCSKYQDQICYPHFLDFAWFSFARPSFLHGESSVSFSGCWYLYFCCFDLDFLVAIFNCCYQPCWNSFDSDLLVRFMSSIEYHHLEVLVFHFNCHKSFTSFDYFGIWNCQEFVNSYFHSGLKDQMCCSYFLVPIWPIELH